MARVIITAEDVLAQARGATLVVPAGALVTERAIEVARESGIDLQGAASTPDAGGGGSPGGRAQALPVVELASANTQFAPPPAQAPSPAVAPPSRAAPVIDASATKVGVRLIVTAFGRNQPGVLAEIAGAIAAQQGDILEVSQAVRQGFFHLAMVVELQGASSSTKEFKVAVECLSREDGFRVLVQHERVFEFMHRI